jgi:hypothetical protein
VAACAAAAADDVSHACASIADDAARLACYDRAFGRPAGKSPQTEGTAAPALATAAAAPSPEKDRREFGLSKADTHTLEAKAAAAREPESIAATVASVRRRGTGEQVFVLDDGQVWMEVEAYATTRVRAGDAVTIRKAALGSYMLVTPKKVATHVRRLK